MKSPLTQKLLENQFQKNDDLSTLIDQMDSFSPSGSGWTGTMNKPFQEVSRSIDSLQFYKNHQSPDQTSWAVGTSGILTAYNETPVRLEFALL